MLVLGANFSQICKVAFSDATERFRRRNPITAENDHINPDEVDRLVASLAQHMTGHLLRSAWFPDGDAISTASASMELGEAFTKIKK